jgi:uncharacterized protein (TIGR03437 family)
MTLFACAIAGLAGQSYSVQVIAGNEWVGDGGPATAALLVHVEGLAVDLDGNLYISDADGHRVRKVTRDGKISTFAGTGVRGLAGDGGPATAAQLNTPYGIAADPRGGLYIADLGNARLRRVDLDGRITTVAGGGELAAADAEGGAATMARLLAPRNVAVDALGNVYFSDFAAHSVYRLLFGSSLVRVAGTGASGYSGDNAAATRARLSFPTALAIASDGTLYIGDSQNHVIRKVVNGTISTIIRVTTPTGMALDPFGGLYIADSGAGRAIRLAHDGEISTVSIPARDIALHGSIVYAAREDVAFRINKDDTVTIVAGGGDPAHGDGGDAKQARLNHPASLARDASGNLFVADRANRRVRAITAEGIISTILSSRAPSAIDSDDRGALYIADAEEHTVRKLGGGASVTIAGPDSLKSPQAVAVDTHGNVFIADTGNNRIRKVDGAGIVSTVLSNLNEPAGVAIAANGDLYFSEAAGQRVQRLAPTGEISDLAAGFWTAPRGIALSTTGEIHVADSAGRIVRLDSAGTPSIVASNLGSPWDLAVDAAGNIYVADFEGDRLLKLTPKASPNDEGPVRAIEVVNAATLQPGPIAPGMLLALLNTGLTAADLNDVTIRFAEIPAIPMIDGGKLFIEVPYAVSSLSSVQLSMSVKNVLRVQLQLAVVPAAPALFSGVLNENASRNSPENPAARGSIVTVYATGAGTQPISLSIAGYEAEIVWSGLAPGYRGLMQINARVPGGYLAPGEWPAVLTAGGVSSPPLTLFIR